MPLPLYLRSFISWIVSWITKGSTRPQVEYQFAQRWPDISTEVRNVAIEHSYLAIEFAHNANVLLPDQPLDYVLGGFTPPAQTVTASWEIVIKTEPKGVEITKYVRRRVSWSMNYQEVLDQIAGDISQLVLNYPGSVVSITFVPPLLY